MNLLSFLFGTVVGGLIGVCAVCLCCIAGESDRDMDKLRKDKR